MFKNFFRILFRNFSGNKLTTSINVAGLAIGLAASLLILLWVQNELSYEKFNKDAEEIFRIEEDQFYSGEKYHVTVTPFPSGPVWKEKIPEIKEQVRINRLPRFLFRNGEKVFFESSLIAADSTIFRVFTMPLLTGNPETALNSPYSVVLTKKLAEKYFGQEDPLGKSLSLENKIQVMVTGVMENLPNNSNFTFEAILPYSLQRELRVQTSTSWGNNSIFTYVKLGKGADREAVNKKLTDVVLEFVPQTQTKFMVFPLLDIHLHQQFGYGENNGPVTAVYVFTLIAVFVLVIACINFINLSTARATARAKEIGIKKAAGADRLTIFRQFMLESAFLVFISLVFALLIVGLLLNTFNSVSGKHFTMGDLLSLKFILGFVAAGVVVGIASGIYPALYLSSFKPAAVLKGETNTGGKGRLRQILVVVQFSLSILIAITAIFMFLQLKFLQNKQLGFNKENLLCIPMAENMKPKYSALKKELMREPLVKGVTASTSNPIRIGSNSGGADWDGRDPQKSVLIGVNAIDYDYTSTMGMELVSGRDFSLDFTGDMARDTIGNFLINEEVAKIMGTGDPVGKSFRFMGLNGTIVGVMKNFHFKGADQVIEPIAFALTDVRRLNVILVKLAGNNVPEALKSVEKIWQTIVPDYPLDYTFIDQDYDNLFRSQIRLTALLKYFTILAVIIACLGLYGLSLHSAERRTNEVGIRKVMGAGSWHVIYSLSSEFIVLVVISIIIATPAGYIIVSKLLKEFAYRIEINYLIFAGISLSAIIIAFLTVGIQAFKATGINPAEALKVE
jgi:predicted permease